MNHPHTNRLAHETSPYLLQHAHNPVDWYPWGEEALEIALADNKPILLSIGYSSCHWCHVMERESFENEAIATLMNRHFVNIKVDREERPDVDSIYMNYVQMTTGHGGWPLTVFLTPDQLPFYGGTYFPPQNQHGRPGFRTVLQSVSDFYRNERDKIDDSRGKVIEALGRNYTAGTKPRALEAEILSEAFYGLLQGFDNSNGGFGSAPKFPAAMALSFLFRIHKRTDSPSALEAATFTLKKMACGGICDQLGGGFHRYTVDAAWLVPHFEKMLYDNALLVRAYLEAFRTTGDPFFEEVAVETLKYVQRDLTSAEGGFYSAEDADSEGEEGKFYVWSLEEIDQILGEDAEAFNRYFDVSVEGNWEGSNILNQPHSPDELANRLKVSSSDLKDLLDRCREKLLGVRETRTRPGLDDKVLASWNGLMLTAFAEAAATLSNDSFLTTAQKNAEFIADSMMNKERLRRTWKAGQARLNGYLDDYAHVAEGFLALHEVTGEARWKDLAHLLVDTTVRDFSGPGGRYFYFTSSDHEELLIRPVEFFDNATPSGNSTMAVVLLQLSLLTGEDDFRVRASRMLESTASIMPRYPSSLANWLKALDLYLHNEGP